MRNFLNWFIWSSTLLESWFKRVVNLARVKNIYKYNTILNSSQIKIFDTYIWYRSIKYTSILIINTIKLSLFMSFLCSIFFREANVQLKLRNIQYLFICTSIYFCLLAFLHTFISFPKNSKFLQSLHSYNYLIYKIDN